MSFFNGLAGGVSRSFSSSAKSLGTNLISNILERASSLSSGGGGASFAGLPAELSNAKSLLEAAMRIRYAQGWQWNVEADGFSRLDMYAKDVTYSFGNVETESKIIGATEFNKPSHISAGSITMTVRDNENGDVMTWFKKCRGRVSNGDGTINLPSSYLMNVRIYRVSQDGQSVLEEEARVFPTTLGEISRVRDAVGEFASFPVTFIKYTSAGSALNGLIGGLTGGITNSVQSGATNLIKF